jgi:hypothetical protein
MFLGGGGGGACSLPVDMLQALPYCLSYPRVAGLAGQLSTFVEALSGSTLRVLSEGASLWPSQVKVKVGQVTQGTVTPGTVKRGETETLRQCPHIWTHTF